MLFVDQPGIGHKGGGIIFDENGVMMLALGDGGGSRGRDAQDYSKLLDGHHPHHSADERPWLRHPGGWPFIGQEGIAPELFAKGFATWGLCRDAATGDMWIATSARTRSRRSTTSPPHRWHELRLVLPEGTQVRYDGASGAQPATGVGVPARRVRPGVDRRLRLPQRRHPAPQGGMLSDMSGPMFAIGEGLHAGAAALPEQGRIVTAVKMGVDGEVIILTLHNGGYRLVAVMKGGRPPRCEATAGSARRRLQALRRPHHCVLQLVRNNRASASYVDAEEEAAQRADPTTMTDTTTQVAVNGGSDRGGNGATILDRVVVRFAGDLGDGMQLTGDRFTSVSALYGNDLSTLPEYPVEIRAPAGTVHGVSSFQVHISDHPITTPGDEPNVLVAMNPAALRADLGRLEQAER